MGRGAFWVNLYTETRNALASGSSQFHILVDAILLFWEPLAWETQPLGFQITLLLISRLETAGFHQETASGYSHPIWTPCLEMFVMANPPILDHFIFTHSFLIKHSYLWSCLRARQTAQLVRCLSYKREDSS